MQLSDLVFENKHYEKRTLTSLSEVAGVPAFKFLFASRHLVQTGSGPPTQFSYAVVHGVFRKSRGWRISRSLTFI
jgi:hypothetical protein